MKEINPTLHSLCSPILAVAAIVASTLLLSDFSIGQESASEPAPLSSTFSQESFGRAALLDSIYRAWMYNDDNGKRSYWFRKTFEITEHPSGGHIWIAADDNYSIFVNGSFVAEDGQEELDLMNVDVYDIGGYLKMGSNLISLQAEDVDSSRGGVKVGIVYETIPDLDAELDKMVQREVFEQGQRAEEARQSAEVAKLEVDAAETGGPSPKMILEIRTIKKNKLY